MLLWKTVFGRIVAKSGRCVWLVLNLGSLEVIISVSSCPGQLNLRDSPPVIWRAVPHAEGLWAEGTSQVQ